MGFYKCFHGIIHKAGVVVPFCGRLPFRCRSGGAPGTGDQRIYYIRHLRIGEKNDILFRIKPVSKNKSPLWRGQKAATMDKITYTLGQGTLLAVPAEDADKLLRTGDGTAALVYLWLLRSAGHWDPERCARELVHTHREVAAAVERLEKLGLIRSGRTGEGRAEEPAQHLRPAAELPEYSAQDVSLRAEADGVFSALVAETQRLLGRMLSGADLKTLFGIYDYLALPAEVILQLVQYCIDFRKGSRMPGMRQIEREAYAWADRELVTLERVEDYIRRQQTRSERVEQFREELQLRGRALSGSERRFLEAWADWGFGPEAVALAYDRTVLQTGGLKWAYMNSILRSWHEAGLHSVQEIREGDRLPQRRRPAEVSAPAQPSQEEMERMRKLLEKMNG